MAKMINLKINGMDVSVPAGSTVLEAAREYNDRDYLKYVEK